MVLILAKLAFRVRITRSFRPLAGIMVLINKAIDDFNQKLENMFPSPCGDYGSYRI